MDLLKTLALPQSAEHVHLLLVIGGMVSAVLFPYIGFLLGTSWLSLVYDRKGRRSGDPREARFARDVVSISMANPSLPVFLGILPAVALVLIQAEITQGTNALAVVLSGWGTLFLATGSILLRSYWVTFRIGEVLSDAGEAVAGQPSGEPGSIEAFALENAGRREKTGRWGIRLLVLASTFLVASVGILANGRHWIDIESLFEIFLAPDVLLRIPLFAGVVAGITGVGVIFFFFSWEGGIPTGDATYSGFVRSVAFHLSTVGFVVIPLCMIATLLLLPPESLSALFFGLAGGVLVLLLLAAQLLYAYAHEGRGGYASYAFVVFASALVLMIVNDNVASGNTVQYQAALLNHRYDAITEEMETRLGIAAPALTGADIYNSKCSACHLFDVKKVGPPYNIVIKKYFGRKSQLIAFVLAPRKVDPAYPSMPSQGLKPSEADSIATYLLARVSGSDSTATSVVAK
jgi:cytochrome c